MACINHHYACECREGKIASLVTATKEVLTLFDMFTPRQKEMVKSLKQLIKFCIDGLERPIDRRKQMKCPWCGCDVTESEAVCSELVSGFFCSKTCKKFFDDLARMTMQEDGTIQPGGEDGQNIKD